MAARGAKDAIVNKLGFKSNGSKMELELDKLRRENAHLKKNLDEMSRRHGHGKHPDSDKTKLLERIVSLETLRERNSQQLLSKDQEIATLRQQLRSAQGEVVASLHSQLDEKKKEAEQREKLFQSLTVETENLKNRLASVTERCQALEKRDPAAQVQTGDVAVIQDQLRDALEKNQHWLVYDQQREAYVQGLLARTQELEQQLSRPNQTSPQQGKEGPSEANKTTTAAQQEQLLKQLQEAQREAGALREKAMQAERELAELRQRSGRVEGEAQAERQRSGQASREAQEQRERAAKAEREAEGLREKVVRAQEEARGLRGRYEEKRRELENADTLLEEERKRASDLLIQVNLLQKSMLNQHDEQKRMAVLEQQMQLSVRDFETEKLDRQDLQQQLHRMLKELRKAREQISRLEATKHQSRFSEPSSYTRLERLTVDDPTSPSKVLDESFLECPKCHTTYPTSQHRELLTHIDYCCA
ncbi:centrosomal protein of 55 kDa [Alosa sapidissima]|uniref:centrosomal protein of 55 kDa n=1 Tax=Alosa sapidissima TaxID=34773 RepID=UPI001C0870F2|nr:centrosomal protein of 55 kDa [Alosa sapidissima]XP_041939428.1 centrosomal protein of 55 kDa [Alosa sapidissima]XP_041939429.1 centrosomal protein of 55 kDa [Alosa sapidissima]